MIDKVLYRLNAVFFVAGLMTLGILFFIVPKSNRSELEKRDLAKMPQFTIEKLKSGSFIDSLEQFYSDNFPFRDFFVSFSFGLKQNYGIASKKIAFYNEGLDVDAGVAQLKNESDSSNKDSLKIEDEKEVDFHNEGNASDVKSLSRGLLIYEGMAIQMFGGSRNTAIYLANSVNEMRKVLPDSVKLFLGVTPTHGEFYLPSEYIKTAVSEKNNIDSIYKYLHEDIIPFDICTELFKHKKEYIFFNTDHHWTGTGAYYAYVAFCKSAGIKPLELKEMTKAVIPNFLGSLYRLTRDKRLEENKDSVVYYKVPIGNRSYHLYGNGYGQIRNSNLYFENAQGGNAYGVFLGGDVHALCVVSNQQNGRRVLIFKNSFGNAIAPYFVSHFERTYVADYRYFDCNLVDFVKKNKITDVVIMHNSFSANTPSHVDMLKAIIKNEKECIAHSLPSKEDMFPVGVLLTNYYKEHLKNLNGKNSKNVDTKKQTLPNTKKDSTKTLIPDTNPNLKDNTVEKADSTK
jgi:hypothetical protein